ncbi:hypothetical protein C5S32_09145 [ANME-1 cluster archaeon GoMg1]|nr:hypothetical protein [ANME-1 cluster archaeon GoMg1]
MKANKLKQSIVLEKSIDYLSILHELRKESDKSQSTISKLAKIDSFLHKCLELSEYYDYLNSNLNLDLRLFKKFSDKNILKELLNRSHSEGDIFLYADSNVFQKGNQKDIRTTIYRKLLERLASKFLDSPSVSKVLMSKKHREFLVSKIKLNVLKDYKALSLTKIPPYRIWDKKNKKMTYFKPIPIDQEIDKLEGGISRFREKIQPISNEHKKLLLDYYQNWWLEYKKIINEKYNDIANHFQYYDGIHIKISLSKSILKIPDYPVNPQTDLALCEGKKRSKSGSFEIEIDGKIYTILFLDDYFNEVYDLTIELSFDLNSYREDSIKRIEGSIDHDLKNELFDLFKINYDDVIFETFSDKMLSIMGIHLTGLKKQIGIQYNQHLQRNAFKIARLNKKDKVSVKNIESQRQKGGETIIISSTIIPDAIKKKYEKDKDIYLMDINSFFLLIRENVIGTDEIIEDIIYPFLKDKLKNKEIDTRLYQAQKLLSTLKNCPKGIKGWWEFEDICIDIIDFVFRDSFRNFKIKTQSRTYNNLDIRDAIVQNTGKDFWKELRLDYDAKNMVFEFKNLTNEFGKEELIQTSDYLDKESLGKVGIIFSRKGLSKAGVKKQRSLLTNAKKLILVLTENDLIDLVNKKLRNEEPEQILEALKFELETSV